ncbi:MAG: YidB family protein [Gammaproteobacteria bacterium]
MDIMDIAVKALGSRLGNSGQNADLVKSVIGKLVGSGDSLDLNGLVNGLKEKGLGNIADSWLGDGENGAISINQVKEVLGGGQVADAAQRLGTDEGSLLDGLKEILPEMVDKSSRGGSLLDSLGGLSGLARKFL